MRKRHQRYKNPALIKHFERCEQLTVQKYERVPEEIRTDVLKAWRWARDHLMRKEGEGHYFSLIRNNDGTISCAFAKPEWNADHCGEGMPTGAEAIIRAVCEYESGY